MVWRVADSRSREIGCAGASSLGAEAGAAAPPRAAAASTSSFEMRPLRPVPRTVARSTPSSAARRRAIGLTRDSESVPAVSALAMEAGSAVVVAPGAEPEPAESATVERCVRRAECGDERVDLRLADVGFREHTDQRADRMGLARVDEPAAQYAIAWRLDLVDDLLGLDVEQRVALADRLRPARRSSR